MLLSLVALRVSAVASDCPTIFLNPENRTNCVGSSVSVTVFATGTNLTYQWRKAGVNLANGAAISGATNDTLVINPAGTGDTGSYDVVVANGCGAVTSAVAFVSVTVPPPCAISGPSIACANALSTFTVPAGMAGYAWTISSNSGYATIQGASDSSNLVVNVSTSGVPFTVSVTFTNSAGCVTNCSKSVTPQMPTATVSGGGTACAGSSVTVQVALTGPSPYTVWWSDGAVNSNVISSPLVRSITNSGTITVTNARANSGCNAFCSGSAVVTINPPPSFTVQPTNTVACFGGAATFYAAASGAVPMTIQWQMSTNGGLSFSNVVGETNATLTFSPATFSDAGKVFRAVFQNACGSATSSNAVLSVSPLPSCLITGPLSVCPNSTASYSGPAGMASYSWAVFGNGSVSGGANGSSVNVNTFAPGTYTVQLSVTDTNGCTSNCSLIGTNRTVGAVLTSGSTNVCLGGSFSMSVSLSGVAPWTLVWGDGFVQTNIASSPATRTVVFNGSVSYTLASVADAACSGTVSGSFSATPSSAPTVTANPADATTCVSNTVSFTASASATPAAAVQWQVSTNGGATFANVSGATSSTYSLSPALTQSGSQYRAVFSNACGSATSAVAILTVITPPTVTITAESQVCLNSTGNVASASTIAGAAYAWTISGATITSPTNQSSITYTAPAGGTITLNVKVTTTNGCTTTATKTASIATPGSSVAEGWANKNGTSWQTALNNGSHRYSEGMLVPFRVVLPGQCGGGTWCVELQYDYGDVSKGKTNGFFDSLGTYDGTESSVDGSECVNYLCGPTSTYPIPLDPAIPAGGQIPGNFTIINGNITTVSAYTTTAAGGGAITKSITLTGTTLSGGARDVIILFGGHLARENEFGPNLGASHFSGSSGKVYAKQCSESSFNAVSVNPGDIVIMSDMRVTKSSSPNPVCVSNLITYTINVANLGPNAWSCTMTDALPAGLAVTSVTPTNTSTSALGELVFAFGQLAAGTSTNVLITARVLGTAPNFLTNSARVSPGTNDPNSFNNYATNVTAVNRLTVITAQPLASTTLCSGLTFTASISATGTGPLLYQWQKNGTNILNATNTTFSIGSVSLSDAGSYAAIVSGACNSATSQVAVLNVRTNVSATGPVSLTNCTGTSATFSTIASGTGPYTYVWRKDGVLQSSTSNTLVIPFVTNSSAGTYTVEVTGPCNTVTNSATLTVNTRVSATPLTDHNICPSNTVTFSTIASGSGPISYQWYRSGVAIGGANSSNLVLTNVTIAYDSNLISVVVSGPCNSVSNSAFLYVRANGTATALQDTTACPGGTAAFSTTVGGAGPFSFAWRKNGTLIVGATNSTLTLTNVTLADAGTYNVQVDGACNGASSSATLTVWTNTSATALSNLVLCVGDTAVFGTVASGTGPFAYQWRLAGTNLPAQTNTTLTITNVGPNDVGAYSVVVNGFCSSVTNAASLSLGIAPSIAPLSNLTNCAGQNVAFLAAVSGSAPLSYSWLKNGTLIPGENSSSLLLTNISAANAGTYSVIVSNRCGVVSSSADLVLKSTTSASALTSLVRCPGEAATFSVTPTGTGPFTFVWRKDGLQLGSTSNTLVLPFVTSADTGSYTVEVYGACNSVTNGGSLLVNTPVTATALSNAVGCPGDSVTFSTVASGTAPFSYVWRHDGQLLGETNASLTIASVSAADAGAYTIEVYGVCGAVTNSASLVVNTAVTATALSPQTVCVGSPVTFATVASGTGPFLYQWLRNGGALTGQTNATLLLSAVTTNDAGLYSVEVRGACGTATNSALLTVNELTTATPLANVTVCDGSLVALATTASGTGPFTYVWRKGGVLLTNETNAVLTIAAATLSASGTYSVEVAGTCNTVTNTAQVLVQALTSATPLSSAVRCPGESVSFSTVASGTGPFSYVWRHGGQLLGNTNASLTIASVNASDAGTYSVEVYGVCGAVTNSASLVVNTAVTATALSPQAVCVGSPVSFATVASGTGPFFYQWLHNGNILAGQTNATLQLTAVRTNEAGTYAVTVQGTCGTVTNSALLTVNELTTATPLLDVTVCDGSPVTLTTVAGGTGPFTYVWRKGGVLLANETNAVLTIAAATLSASGTYSVEVAGTCNTVTNTAQVLVQELTSATPLSSAVRCPGDSVTFNTIAGGTGPFSYVWRHDGQLLGNTNASLTIASVSAADSGTYAVEVYGGCGAVTNSASLVVNTAVTATALSPQTVCVGAPVTFATVASGTGPFFYQWLHNGNPLAGQTNATLLLTAVTTNEAGTYAVAVQGTCGAVTNSALLTVNELTTATPLLDVTVCDGSPLTLTTVAGGTGPFTYVWRKGGVLLVNETNSMLTIASATLTASGSYSVEVAGTCNTVTNTAQVLVQELTSATALSSAVRCPGDSVTFSTVASGTGPFSYVWRHDGLLLAGTNATLTIASLSAADAGTYTIEVYGVCGAVTNSASLVVNTAVTATALSPQTVCVGSPVTFATVASGTGPFAYQWLHNGNAMAGQTNDTLLLTSVTTNAAGSYAVVVQGTCGVVTNSALLTVNELTTATPLVDMTVCDGSLVTLATTAGGTGPFTYVWRKGGVLLVNETNAVLTITAATLTASGTYSVEVAGTCNAVTNTAQVLVQELTSATALSSAVRCPGESVTFSTIASGTAPFSYVWRHDGQLLGETNASLTLAAVSAADAGTYAVEVYGACGAVTNSASLVVNTAVTASALSPQTVCVGSPVTFATVASGTGPFRYQWLHNGNAIVAETNASLFLASVTTNEAGTYAVAVQGTCGVVTNTAVLTVNELTTATPLLDVTVCDGSPVTLTTVAGGTGPFTYVWRKGGVLLAGETNAVLTIPAATLTASGTYSVEVAGTCNTITNTAQVLVQELTSTTALSSAVRCPGESVTFSTIASGTGPFSYVWRHDGLLLAETNASFTIASVTALDAGSYSVEVYGVCGAVTNSASLVVNTAVTATALSPQTVCVGLPVTFATVAAGTGPFTYVWRHDGQLLSETNASLTIASVSVADAGTYAVEVYGLCNSVTNSAVLTVNELTTVQLTADQVGCVGDALVLHAVAGGTGPWSYLWRKDGVALELPNTNTIVISATDTNVAGRYSVEVSGACNVATNSSVISIRQPLSATPLASVSVCPGDTATFSTTASGEGPFTYQWQKGTQALSSTNNLLALTNVTSADAGEYSVTVTGPCGSVTNTATLTVNTAVSAAPIGSQTVCVGSPVLFSVAPQGTGPFTYQWLKGGSAIAGETNASLVIASADTNAAGTYAVVIRGTCGVITNSGSLTVQDAPAIGAMAAQTLCVGDVLTLAPTVSGSGPLAFAWRKNGGALPNATNAVLTFTVASTNDAGNYSLEVTGPCGRATNTAAVLVNVPPSIAAMPNSTNCAGSAVSLTATVSGTGPFSYVWRQNGVLLGGQTNSSLVLAPLSTTNAGAYSVEVTGICGRATNSAVVTVLTNTSATPLANAAACTGGTATFGTVASGAGPFTYVWRRDGGLIAGATNSSIVISNVTSASLGTYSVEVFGLCGSVTNSATLSFGTALTITGVSNQAACQGENLVITATASGSGPFQYVWRRNGFALAGQTNASLSLVNMTSAKTGTYSVEVSGPCGNGTNSAVITLRTNVATATLTNQSWCQGSNATFVISVTSGTPPFAYEWSKNGVPIPTATSNVLTITNVSPADAGTYTVVVRGACNAVTNSATLAVSAGTAATPLNNIVACVGSPAAFSITASGAAPLTYVWRKNGTVLSGVNSNSLVFPSVTATNAGTYSVTVSGGCGSLTSTGVLSISTPITATMPTNVVLCGCDDMIVGPVVTGTGPFTYKWSRNGVLLPEETNGVLNLLKANYNTPATYTVYTYGGCSSTTNTVAVSLNSGGNGHWDNPNAIEIPEFGEVEPYPSTITIACAPPAISHITVTLRGLTHDFPDDLDIMLVAPNGRSIMLMSDCGGGSQNRISGVELVFSDDALTPLPDSAKITNGVYRPTNYGTPDDDVFDAPAPAGPSTTTLASFIGTNPNGVWSLYIVDDHGLDGGSIARGWSLDFSQDDYVSPTLRLANPGVTNGVFSAQMFGIPGKTYFIEGSSDLQQWTILSTNQIPTSPAMITDTNAAFSNYKFFRALGCER